MKISKEVRIGILSTVSVLILFVGYDFLKNGTFFTREKTYYCFYKDIQGLQKSATVQVRGMDVGHVSGLQLEDDKGVKVAITLIKDIDLPVGTVAKLESSLLGTPSISLELGRGPGKLQPGAEMGDSVEGGVVDNLSSELTPRLRELKATIVELDTTIAGVNAIVGAQNQKEITGAIHSIKVTADNLAGVSGTLNKESAEMTEILQNLKNFTGTLAGQDDAIKQIISNANNVTGQLAKAPIQKTVTELQTAAAQMKEVMEKINKGEGSMGLLVNDKELYNNAKNTLATLNKLMADINAHPSRYINVNIIGGKRKD